MVAKGHCKLAYDEDDDIAEVSDYYDFSSTWEGLANEEDGGDEEWEDIDGESQGDDDNNDDDGVHDDVVSVNGSMAPSSVSAAMRRPVVYLSEDGNELTLPSGRVVLHKRVVRRLPRWTPPTPPQRFATTHSSSSSSSMAIGRRHPGGNGSVFVHPHGRFGTAAMQITEREARAQNKVVERSHREFRMKVGVQQNRGYMNRFFRDQTGFKQS